MVPDPLFEETLTLSKQTSLLREYRCPRGGWGGEAVRGGQHFLPHSECVCRACSSLYTHKTVTGHAESSREGRPCPPGPRGAEVRPLPLALSSALAVPCPWGGPGNLGICISVRLGLRGQGPQRAALFSCGNLEGSEAAFHPLLGLRSHLQLWFPLLCGPRCTSVSACVLPQGPCPHNQPSASLPVCAAGLVFVMGHTKTRHPSFCLSLGCCFSSSASETFPTLLHQCIQFRFLPLAFMSHIPAKSC